MLIIYISSAHFQNYCTVCQYVYVWDSVLWSAPSIGNTPPMWWWWVGGVVLSLSGLHYYYYYYYSYCSCYYYYYYCWWYVLLALSSTIALLCTTSSSIVLLACLASLQDASVVHFLVLLVDVCSTGMLHHAWKGTFTPSNLHCGLLLGNITFEDEIDRFSGMVQKHAKTVHTKANKSIPPDLGDFSGTI